VNCQICGRLDCNGGLHPRHEREQFGHAARLFEMNILQSEIVELKKMVKLLQDKNIELEQKYKNIS